MEHTDTDLLDVKVLKTGFWELPKTFYAVLFIEFWERFAFYGLQSVAVIYFINHFKLLEATSSSLFASFSALLYAALSIGGFIGDKVLGLRRTYLLGIIFLIIGYATVGYANTLPLLYLGMGIILMGNVLFKTNAANYVSRCFASNDPRLDSAYTYFYMSINIGSFASMIIVPIVMQLFGGLIALTIGAFGMAIAMLAYFIFYNRFKLSDNYVGKNSKNMLLKTVLIAIIGGVSSYGFALLLHNLDLSQFLLYLVAILIFLIYLFVASKLNHNEAKGMYIAFILILQGIVFWILYMQCSTSVTLFALHNVRLTFFGFHIPAGLTQSFNGLFIMLFSPFLANWYIKMYKNNKTFSIPAKFMIGTFLTGVSFVTLGVAGTLFVDNNAQISLMWVILAYALFSLGELLVSAIGLSMVAQLLPKRFGGFAQGVWGLGMAIGMKIGGQVSEYAALDFNKSVEATTTLHSYSKLFFTLGTATVIIAFLFLLMLKPLSKNMLEVLNKSY